MVIADPAAELVNLVRDMGDPAPPEASPAAIRQAMLVRRRFGSSLPTPFVGPPGADEPVRVATADDGAAIAGVKWRVFGSNYRGILPDRFLDQRDVVPPASFWVGRAMVPPSRRHRLLVWGRPGTVHGYVDCGPAHPDDIEADAAVELVAAFDGDHGEPVGPSSAEAQAAVSHESTTRPSPGLSEPRPVRMSGDGSEETTGEVWELYVDPAAQHRGGGARLLAAAEQWLDGVGLSDQVLSVLGANTDGQAFYVAQGWEPTGRTVPVDLGVVAFDELRFRRRRAVP